MTNSTISVSHTTSVSGLVDYAAKHMVLRLLNQIRTGTVEIVDGEETYKFGHEEPGGLRALIDVHSPTFYRRALFGGNLGVAEAYMEGLWSSKHLVALCRIVAADPQLLNGLAPTLTRLARPAQQLFHALCRNTRARSRRNIAVHYDIGNDFFRLFLDKNLMYSSAVYPNSDSTLEEASWFKNDLICRQLQLQGQDHVLEIGSGWGGFAIQAAREYGCRVTTTTISDAQYEFARQRVREEGLSERISVIQCDYRELKGVYDKIVSIEMIEAVGHHYLDNYFRACSQLLKPCGAMMLQAITIADQHYERHTRRVDYIKRHIFPGSCLTSIARISQAIANGTDLRIHGLRDIGLDYAQTLMEWAERFEARLDDVRALGFSEEFIRKWRFYLAYCEAGFRERYISDVQVLLAKPGFRPHPELSDFSLGAVQLSDGPTGEIPFVAL